MARRVHMRSRGGMTILEIMIVLAIIGLAGFLVRSGIRMVTKADLVEDAGLFAAYLKRANQMAIERGELHRVRIDFDKGGYAVEICPGQTSIMRNEALEADPEDAKAAIERGKQRMQQMPEDALAAGDPEEGTKRAMALGGAHVGDRMCQPVADGVTGTVPKRGEKPNMWMQELRKGNGVKFKELWVQHRDKSVTDGQEAIYFFPQGSAEKAVLEMTDGTATFSILVFGLTGRVQLNDGEMEDVDSHMLRDALGKKQRDRESEANR